MNWNWSEVSLWFVTAFVGAGIIKLLDLAVSRHSERRTRKESKVAVLLNYIKEFGELAELYGFFANTSSRIATDENGEFKRDASGKFVIESRNLEPEPRFEEAIKALKGTDINAVIAQKIATIHLASSEVNDIAMEFDPSGDLKKQFSNLYIKTVWSIDIILSNKNSQKPSGEFSQLMEALKDAVQVRRDLRSKVQRYLE